MGKTIFDRNAQQELLDRLARLTPDSQRRWGKMTAPEMVCHLKDSLDVELGLKPAKLVSTVLANPILRWLVIHVMPWPKGKVQTAPEMLLTRPASWDTDVANLKQLLLDAVQRGEHGQWAPHPAFGKMSGKQYGYLIYRHFDHHFTQFAV